MDLVSVHATSSIEEDEDEWVCYEIISSLRPVSCVTDEQYIHLKKKGLLITTRNTDDHSQPLVTLTRRPDNFMFLQSVERRSEPPQTPCGGGSIMHWASPLDNFMFLKSVERQSCGCDCFRYCNDDTDGFVIPSLTVGDPDISDPHFSEVRDSKPPSPKAKKEEEKMYLGPHGAPPSQVKQQELSTASRKQRLKQKLKEADQKFSGTGLENKAEYLQELVGGRKVAANMPKSSPKDWLDPHCHESQFERAYSQ